MFFTKTYSVLALALFAVSSVMAAPLPMPLVRRAASAHVPYVATSVNGDMVAFSLSKRDVTDSAEESLEKRATIIPDTIATKSSAGDEAPVPFNKRATTDDAPIPDTIATKSEGDVVVPFANTKRQVNTFPSHLASRSDGGEVVSFEAKRDVPTLQGRSAHVVKRQVNTFPSHLASRSDGGEIVAF